MRIGFQLTDLEYAIVRKAASAERVSVTDLLRARLGLAPGVGKGGRRPGAGRPAKCVRGKILTSGDFHRISTGAACKVLIPRQIKAVEKLLESEYLSCKRNRLTII